MNLPTPKYFVLDQNDNLHGYDRVDLLKCDLATNKETPPKKLFRLNETGLTISYTPITAAELNAIHPPTLHSLSGAAPEATALRQAA